MWLAISCSRRNASVVSVAGGPKSTQAKEIKVTQKLPKQV